MKGDCVHIFDKVTSSGNRAPYGIYLLLLAILVCSHFYHVHYRDLCFSISIDVMLG